MKLSFRTYRKRLHWLALGLAVAAIAAPSAQASIAQDPVVAPATTVATDGLGRPLEPSLWRSDGTAVRPDDQPVHGPGVATPAGTPARPDDQPVHGPGADPAAGPGLAPGPRGGRSLPVPLVQAPGAQPVADDSGGIDWPAVGIGAGVGLALLAVAGMALGALRRHGTLARA